MTDMVAGISKAAVEREAAMMEASSNFIWARKLRALRTALDRSEADKRFILEERDRTFALMLARAEAAEAERERLALAICGGEDAPGYANAQTVETLERVAKQNQQSHGATINSLLAAEAERDRLGCELNVARYGRPDFAWSVHLEVMAELTARAEAAEADAARLREALTPSGATKAAYIGEISITVPGVDEDGVGFSDSIDIPWTAIKQVMAMISARTELKETKE